MYKRLVILSAIILGALCGLVWLGYHSVQIWATGMEGTRLGEFAAVAEQVRQDINRKLDEFMAGEEGRRYTEYQNYYVPDNVIAGQQQMPVLRSPLAGKLDHGLAYGNFQIGPDGKIITPNDELELAQDADWDVELLARVNFNRANVKYNLLPALSQVKTDSIGLVLNEKEDAFLKRSEAYKEILDAAGEMGQKQATKSKAPQALEGKGKNLLIASFQNPDLKAQIVNRSRASIQQDMMSNTASRQPRPMSQTAPVTVQADVELSSQASRPAVAVADKIVGRTDHSAPYDEDAVSQLVEDADKPSEILRESQATKKLEEQKTPERLEQATTQLLADRRAEGAYSSRRAASGAIPPAQKRQTDDSYTGGGQVVGPQDQLSQAIPMQAEMSQEELDMVPVHIGTFVPLKVPCKEGEESVFGGQVFMLRHIQIEDKHFVQGFQLNEEELIREVEGSARQLMREGMSFELAERANGSSAYTAILDFGFGKLILNLIENDPQRIAKKISEMRNWYFSTITVVLLAATLGLASLWRNARAQLRLARKKDDFISAVSHELRTPLTSIRMYSEMLEKNWVKSKDKVAEYYKNMRQESERLSRLIENVLDFSRIQRGRKRYDFNLGDMNKCVADVVEMMRPYAAQNGFAIVMQLGELGPAAFDGDAVTQIVVNLLDNAVKYARNADDKTIIVRTKGDHEFIMIEVEDRGPGVPHRQRKRIFEEFYRIGAEATRETTGTGLGLALVKKFAQAHNGFVEILNARPRGAIFRVALPANANA